MKQYLEEFPDFDTELYVPEGWEDHSWHNDEMPRAVLVRNMPFGEVQYCLWQDYVDIDKRERGDFRKRIAFYIYVNGEVVFTYETDDLEKAKEVINGFIYDEDNEVVTHVIKHGTQEPFMNKPCVAHQICHEDKIKVLDKLREEIDRQQKWLLQAGYTTCNVDIALDAIKAAVAEMQKGARNDHIC